LGDEAQINTLEGFAAAFVIIFAVTFGLQATATMSTGGVDQEITAHDERLTNDVLLQSKANGELKPALLNWTEERDEGFNGSADGEVFYNRENRVPGEFGDALRLLDERDIAYSIHLVCDGTRYPFVRQGDGGDNPVSSSVTVTLNDDDELADGTRLDRSRSYPCENVDDDTNLYNVVEVKLTAWRT